MQNIKNKLHSIYRKSCASYMEKINLRQYVVNKEKYSISIHFQYENQI